MNYRRPIALTMLGLAGWEQFHRKEDHVHIHEDSQTPKPQEVRPHALTAMTTPTPLLNGYYPTRLTGRTGGS